MSIEIKVPSVGESITEATIAEWVKKDGDAVERDEVILVLETDKASVEVVAESDGALSTMAAEGDTVDVGAVVGSIDPSATGAKSSPSSEPASAGDSPPPPPETSKPQTSSSAANHLSPAVQRVVSEKGLDPKSITPTGPKGNITKGDALSATPQQSPSQSNTAPSAIPPLPQVQSRGGTGETRREPMSRIRKRIAERLVEAQQTAAILTTFNEVDMSQLMKLRTQYKESFKEKYGVGLGFMGFFVKASVEALQAFPKVNAYIEGTDILYHDFCNVGIAVGTEKGLIVPVVKNADQMSIAEIETSIRHYALKAREGKISIDDLSDGTFTISNGGVYGSLMSTPILNPPQSAILGMHKIEERPIAVNGEVVIRPMMYLALSYDHRVIDGSESVSFLVRIKECLEDPSRMLLGI